MNKTDGMKNSPYGNLSGVLSEDDLNRLVYVYKVEQEDEDFRQPSNWMVLDALGNFVYFKTRDRKKAQEICDTLFGVKKYSVVNVKNVQIR